MIMDALPKNRLTHRRRPLALEALEARIMLNAALNVFSAYDDFRFLAGDGLPEVNNTYFAEAPADTTMVEFIWGEWSESVVLDDDPTDDWSAEFNMSAARWTEPLHVTAYSGQDVVAQTTHDINIALLPDWMACEDTTFTATHSFADGYHFDEVTVSHFEDGVKTPDSWVLRVPGIEKPFLDLANKTTGFEINSLFELTSDPHGNVEATNYEIGLLFKVLDQKVFEKHLAFSHGENVSYNDVSFEMDIQPTFSSSLELEGIGGSARISPHFKASFTVFKARIPLLSFVGLPPGVLDAPVKVSASVEFGPTPGHDHVFELTPTIYNGGVGFEWARAAPALEVDLTGEAGVELLHGFGRGLAEVEGKLNQGIISEYTQEEGWTILEAPGFLSLEGRARYETLWGFGPSGDMDVFEWTIADWDFIEQDGDTVLDRSHNYESGVVANARIASHNGVLSILVDYDNPDSAPAEAGFEHRDESYDLIETDAPGVFAGFEHRDKSYELIETDAPGVFAADLPQNAAGTGFNFMFIDESGQYHFHRLGAETVRNISTTHEAEMDGTQDRYRFYMPKDLTGEATITLQVDPPEGWGLALYDTNWNQPDGLDAFVHESTGWPALNVTGLAAGPYILAVNGPAWADGEPYSLAFDIPQEGGEANVVLVIDVSGSMRGTRLTDAKAAANEFIDLMNPGDRIGVVSFSSSADVEYPLTLITHAADAKVDAKAAVYGLAASGWTSIGAGIRLANDELANFPDEPMRAIILMTDGEENRSPWAEDVVLDEVPEDVRLFTIGFGGGVDMGFLRDLAYLRGGDGYAAPEGSDLMEIYLDIVGAAGVQEVAMRWQDSISPGEQASRMVNVDPSSKSATFMLTWGGSDLDLVLVDPLGNALPRESHDGVEFIEGPTSETYRIAYPESGYWEFRVLGTDVPEPDYSFTGRVFTDSELKVSLVAGPGNYDPGDEVLLQVKIDEGVPVVGAHVAATVVPPDNPHYGSFALTLREDAAAGDGIYSAVFDRTLWGGDYAVDIAVSGTSNLGFPFERTLAANFAVAPPPLPLVFAEDVEVLEGDFGTTDAIFRVGISHPSLEGPVTVAYSTLDGTAVAGVDYVPAEGTLTFEPDGPLEAFVAVPVFGNLKIDGDRDFRLALSDPANAEIATEFATATILDDDVPTPVNIGDDAPMILTYTDADGTAARVVLRGAQGAVLFSGANIETAERGRQVAVEGTDLEIYRIILDGTSARTSLALTARGGEDGTVFVGGIAADGDMGAINANGAVLLGDVEVAGALGRLALGGTTGPQSTVSIGESENPRQAVTMLFGQVSDLTIASDMPIRSLVATEWLDTNGVADQIAAPWLGTLLIRGNPRAGLAGNFQGTLALSGGAAPLTLGIANVSGTVDGGNWQIDGPAGTIRAGQWASGAIQAESLRALLVTGNPREGLAGDFKGSVNLSGVGAPMTLGRAAVAGTVDGGDWQIGGAAGTVRAGQWASGAIQAESLRALLVTGNPREGLAGDFQGSVNLTGGSAPMTLGRAVVSGAVDGGDWQIADAAGAIRAGQWASGAIQAESLRALLVIGNPREGLAGDFQGSVNLTGGSAPLTLGTARVGGTVDGGDWQIGGAAGAIRAGEWAAGDIQTESLRSIVVAGDFAATCATDDNLARLVVGNNLRGRLDVKGDLHVAHVRGSILGARMDVVGELRALAALGDFDDSTVDAGRIGRVAVRGRIRDTLGSGVHFIQAADGFFRVAEHSTRTNVVVGQHPQGVPAADFEGIQARMA